MPRKAHPQLPDVSQHCVVAEMLHGLQAPLGQPMPDDDPDDVPEEEPEDEPEPELTHMPMVVSHCCWVIVQSVQLPPAMPHMVSPGVWQAPLLSQHPVVQVDAQSPVASSPVPALLPVLLPLESSLVLPLALPALASSPAPVPVLLLPVLDPEATPASPGAPPGPSVAHANERAPTAMATMANGGKPRRKCILSVYLPALPPQAVHPGTHAPRRARDLRAPGPFAAPIAAAAAALAASPRTSASTDAP
jgi:hypothetical protein